MRCFLFASLLLLSSVACNKKLYKDRKAITLSIPITADSLRPQFEKVLYRTTIDGKAGIKKFHISGILYLRNLDDNSIRVVFQSEMGNTFFDFGWDKKDSFTVYHIIDLMNRETLVKTLRKDFELLFLRNMQELPSGIYSFNNNQQETFIRFEREKGFAYYVIDENYNLKRIEHADDKRKVVELIMKPESPLKTLADTIMISHLRAGFTIHLNKIQSDVEE